MLLDPNEPLDSYICALIFFCIIQILAVAGRVYVRVFLVKAFGKDDVACLVTLVISTAFCACIFALWPLSHLKDIGAFPGENLYPTINLVLSCLCLYIAGTMALKISLGLLLLRVLVKRWMKVTVYVVMAISTAYGTAFFFVVLFQCGNPKMFPPRIAAGQCLAVSTIDGLSYTHGALQAAADLTCAVLPIMFLWNAAFSRRAKISVGAILVLGSAGCICTFIRLGWVHSLSMPTGPYLHTARTIALLSGVELSIGLVCISLATYRPLLHKWIRRRTDTYYYDQSGAHSDFVSQHGTAEEMITTTASTDHRYNHRSMASQSQNKNSVENMDKTWAAGNESGSEDSWHGPLGPSRR